MVTLNNLLFFHPGPHICYKYAQHHLSCLMIVEASLEASLNILVHVMINVLWKQTLNWQVKIMNHQLNHLFNWKFCDKKGFSYFHKIDTYIFKYFLSSKNKNLTYTRLLVRLAFNLCQNTFSYFYVNSF